LRVGTISLTLLLAFLLRTYELGAQSLWFDEGHSVWVARGNILGLLAERGRWEIHPPFYFYLLRHWMQIAGQSEYAVRFLSVMCGLLTVALAYWLGSLLVRRTRHRDPRTDTV